MNRTKMAAMYCTSMSLNEDLQREVYAENMFTP